MRVVAPVLAAASPASWGAPSAQTWRNAPAVRMHLEPKSLVWGFRLVVAAVSDIGAAAAYATATLPPISSPDFGTVAAVALTAASTMAAAWAALPPPAPATGCAAGEIGVDPGLLAPYAQQLLPGDAGLTLRSPLAGAAPGEVAAAVMGANILIVSATTPTLFLALASPGTRVHLMAAVGSTTADAYRASAPGQFVLHVCATARLSCYLHANPFGAPAHLATSAAGLPVSCPAVAWTE